MCGIPVLHCTAVCSLTYSGGVLEVCYRDTGNEALTGLIEGNDCGSLVTIIDKRTNWSDSGLVTSLCVFIVSLGNELNIVELCYYCVYCGSNGNSGTYR